MVKANIIGTWTQTLVRALRGGSVDCENESTDDLGVSRISGGCLEAMLWREIDARGKWAGEDDYKVNRRWMGRGSASVEPLMAAVEGIPAWMIGLLTRGLDGREATFRPMVTLTTVTALGGGGGRHLREAVGDGHQRRGRRQW